MELNQVIYLHIGSGMVGYVGKLSETFWMRRTHAYLNSSSPALDFSPNTVESDSPMPGSTMPALTCFMDEENLLSIDEDHVNHYQLPSPATSLLLSEAFFMLCKEGFPLS
jgi:hypothetical protein